MILVVGMITVAVCTILQATMVAALLRVLAKMTQGRREQFTLSQDTLILTMFLALLLCGNLLQALLWALLFEAYGAFSSLERAFYFSLVNFTTLGYGDVVLPEDYAVLGPLEAANGILMLGLTTSTLFAVMGYLLRGQIKFPGSVPRP